MQFILFYLTFDLADDLTEMRVVKKLVVLFLLLSAWMLEQHSSFIHLIR